MDPLLFWSCWSKTGNLLGYFQSINYLLIWQRFLIPYRQYVSKELRCTTLVSSKNMFYHQREAAQSIFTFARIIASQICLIEILQDESSLLLSCAKFQHLRPIVPIYHLQTSFSLALNLRQQQSLWTSFPFDSRYAWKHDSRYTFLFQADRDPVMW